MLALLSSRYSAAPEPQPSFPQFVPQSIQRFRTNAVNHEQGFLRYPRQILSSIFIFCLESFNNSDSIGCFHELHRHRPIIFKLEMNGFIWSDPGKSAFEIETH